jgi:hypothetical protein
MFIKQMAQGKMLSDKNPRRTDLIEQIVVKMILDKVPAEQMLFSQTSQSHCDR